MCYVVRNVYNSKTRLYRHVPYKQNAKEGDMKMNSARTFLILLAACCIFGYGGYRYAGEKLQKKYDKDLEDMRDTLSEQMQEEASLEEKKEATELDADTEKNTNDSEISDEEIKETMKLLRNMDVYMITSDEKMNIRKGPSTQDEILGNIGRGSVVMATGEKSQDQKWARVLWDAANEQEAWLYIAGNTTKHLEGNAIQVLSEIGLYYKDVANQSIDAHNQVVEEATSKLNAASSNAQEMYEEYQKLGEKYDTVVTEYNTLTGEYNSLQEKYNGLLAEYNNLVDTYNQLKNIYEDAFAQ
mgnify:FL=1